MGVPRNQDCLLKTQRDTRILENKRRPVIRRTGKENGIASSSERARVESAGEGAEDMVGAWKLISVRPRELGRAGLEKGTVHNWTRTRL
jgi:hypothetical protein